MDVVRKLNLVRLVVALAIATVLVLLVAWQYNRSKVVDDPGVVNGPAEQAPRAVENQSSGQAADTPVSSSTNNEAVKQPR